MSNRKQVCIACVTGQYNCERIINAAACIAQDAGASLEIVSVLCGSCTEDELGALEYLNSISRTVGAQMTILYNDNPVFAVTEYVKRIKATYVITGMPDKDNKFISLLSAVLPKVRIISIPDATYDSDYTAPELLKYSATKHGLTAE